MFAILRSNFGVLLIADFRQDTKHTLRLVPKHTVKVASVATCVNLTDSGSGASLLARRSRNVHQSTIIWEILQLYVLFLSTWVG